MARLGFESYELYLASAQWEEIRARVFKFKGKSCIRCGEFATQVHHGTYDYKTMSGASITRLWPVCGDCHVWAEFTLGGLKKWLSRPEKKSVKKYLNSEKTQFMRLDCMEFILN